MSFPASPWQYNSPKEVLNSETWMQQEQSQTLFSQQVSAFLESLMSQSNSESITKVDVQQFSVENMIDESCDKLS